MSQIPYRTSTGFNTYHCKELSAGRIYVLIMRSEKQDHYLMAKHHEHLEANHNHNYTDTLPLLFTWENDEGM